MVVVGDCVSARDVFTDRRIVANEAVTKSHLQRLRGLLVEYKIECGGFPAKLEFLLDSPTDARACAKYLLLDDVTDLIHDVTSGPVSGYTYAYSPTGPVSARTGPLFARFELRASPTSPGVNGHTSFVATDTSEVRADP